MEAKFHKIKTHKSMSFLFKVIGSDKASGTLTKIKPALAFAQHKG